MFGGECKRHRGEFADALARTSRARSMPSMTSRRPTSAKIGRAFEQTMIRNKLTSGQIYLSLTMLRDQEGSTISIRISHMDQSVENRIRERAYEIWAAHGYVHGQADQHWLAAEREILAASTVALVREPAPRKKRRSPARSRTTKTLAVAS